MRLLPQALLVVVPLFLVYGSLSSGELLYGQDVVGHFYHLFAYVGRSIAGGELPLWDPHSMAGFPLAAAMLAAVFYPFTWLAAVLPSTAFWSFAVAAHLTLAGLFCHAWLRRGLGASPWGAFAGAFVFILSGPVLQVVYAGHPAYLFALAWLPAAAWRAELLLARPRAREAFLLGACLALVVLAGAAQYAIFAGFFLGARLIHALVRERKDARERRAILGCCAGSLAVAVLLSAPQLALTLELIPQTQRVVTNKYDFVTSHSLSPAKLLTFLVPAFFTDPVTQGGSRAYPALDACGFVGLGAISLGLLALARRAPRTLLWASVALLGLLLALGRHSPVFTAAYHLVPGVDLFRAPLRYLAIVALAAAPLTAADFDLLRSPDAAIRRSTRWAAASMGIFLLLLIAVAFFADPVDGITPRPPGDGGDPRAAALASTSAAARRAVRDHRIEFLTWAGLSAAALAAVLAAHARGLLGGHKASLAVLALSAVELLSFAQPRFRGYETGSLEWAETFPRAVKSHPAYPFRLVSPGQQDASDVGRCRVAGLEHLAGYEAMMLRRYVELMNAVHETPPDQTMVMLLPGRPHPALAMLGARLWIVTPPATPDPSWRPLGRLGNGALFEAADALPRAFMVGRASVVASRDERLRLLADPAFDPRRTVLIEEPSQDGPEGAPGEARLAASAAGLYRVDVDSPAGGYLVLGESYYPGWGAELDGRPAPILRANHAVQAVRVPSGRHQVEFRYRPRYLWLGWVAAGAALAAGAVVLVRRPAAAVTRSESSAA